MAAHEPTDPPAATVVIATRDRREDLRRCLTALARQETARRFEVVVVDDGSDPPVDERDIAPLPGVRLLRAGGQGPAGARNAGVARASGEVVAFTDDDTVPESTWLETACAFLEENPTAVGVEGPIASFPFDRLRELSLETNGPGAFYTANVAYRRDVLTAIGGFDSTFPYPHCEDIDLAFRAQRHGPIGFAPAMRVTHVPRPARMRDMIRRGRYCRSELHLLRRHPDRYGRASRLPGPAFAMANAVRFWIAQARAEGAALRDPRRTLRLVAMALGYVATVAVASTREARAER